MIFYSPPSSSPTILVEHHHHVVSIGLASASVTSASASATFASSSVTLASSSIVTLASASSTTCSLLSSSPAKADAAAAPSWRCCCVAAFLLFRLAGLLFFTFRRQHGHRDFELNHCLMQPRWNMWLQDSRVARPEDSSSPSPHSSMQMTQEGQLRALLFVTVNSVRESTTALGAGSVRASSSKLALSCAMAINLLVVSANSRIICCRR